MVSLTIYVEAYNVMYAVQVVIARISEAINCKKQIGVSLWIYDTVYYM